MQEHKVAVINLSARSGRSTSTSKWEERVDLSRIYHLGKREHLKNNNNSNLKQTGLTFLSRMAEHIKSDLINSVNRISKATHLSQ